MRAECCQFVGIDEYLVEPGVLSELTDTRDTVKGVAKNAAKHPPRSIISEDVPICATPQLSEQRLCQKLLIQQQLQEKYAVVSQQLEDLRVNLGLVLPHELLTPLNSILGFSQLLLLRGPKCLPEPNRILSMQTAIYNNALRLQHLIENYLLYTQLKMLEADPDSQRGEIWQNKALLAAEDIVRDVAWPKAKTTRRQEDLRLKLAKASLWISESSVRKIIEELLDNAFKFSEPGTPVYVTTHVNGQQWILSISDRGRGMTAAQIANIGAYMQFERQQYEQQGSGLGLSIVRLLIQLNDGELSIASVPKRGTTVSVFFNRKPSSEKNVHLPTERSFQ